MSLWIPTKNAGDDCRPFFYICNYYTCRISARLGAAWAEFPPVYLTWNFSYANFGLSTPYDFPAIAIAHRPSAAALDKREKICYNIYVKKENCPIFLSYHNSGESGRYMWRAIIWATKKYIAQIYLKANLPRFFGRTIKCPFLCLQEEIE